MSAEHNPGSRRARVQLATRVDAVKVALRGMKPERKLILLDSIVIELRQRIMDDADQFVRKVGQALQ